MEAWNSWTSFRLTEASSLPSIIFLIRLPCFWRRLPLLIKEVALLTLLSESLRFFRPRLPLLYWRSASSLAWQPASEHELASSRCFPKLSAPPSADLLPSLELLASGSGSASGLCGSSPSPFFSCSSPSGSSAPWAVASCGGEKALSYLLPAASPLLPLRCRPGLICSPVFLLAEAKASCLEDGGAGYPLMVRRE